MKKEYLLLKQKVKINFFIKIEIIYNYKEYIMNVNLIINVD